MIHLNRSVEMYPANTEMAEIVHLASIEIGYIVNYLSEISRNRSYIILGCENLVTLEKKANEVFYSEILKLVVSRKNTAQLIKEKNTLESLMKCIRQTNAVAEIIRIILRKSS
jgi:hypothetical protein